jgi:hypothetical protein
VRHREQFGRYALTTQQVLRMYEAAGLLDSCNQPLLGEERSYCDGSPIARGLASQCHDEHPGNDKRLT